MKAAHILRKERLFTVNKQNMNLPITHEDYEAILRQAVAAIEHERQEIAKHIKVQRSVALLPWSHNLLLLSKGLDSESTLCFARETQGKGLSKTWASR
mgnify:CR=1 FL=1